MTNEEHAALRSELTRLRKERVQSEFGAIPASVEYLKKLLDSDSSEDNRQTLYPLLLSESSRSKNDALHLHWLRRRAHDLPEDPLSISGLGFGLVTTQPPSSKEALSLAERALELAKVQDRQVRYCATNLARIALILDDYEALDRALSTLVADAGKDRSEDQCYEFDFVGQIDPRRCNREVFARYKAMQP